MKLEVALQKIRGTSKSIRRKAWEKGLREIHIKKENPFAKEELETDWVVCR